MEGFTRRVCVAWWWIRWAKDWWRYSWLGMLGSEEFLRRVRLVLKDNVAAESEFGLRRYVKRMRDSAARVAWLCECRDSMWSRVEVRAWKDN